VYKSSTVSHFLSPARLANNSIALVGVKNAPGTWGIFYIGFFLLFTHVIQRLYSGYTGFFPRNAKK